jgi:hypothetical protein
MSKNIVVEEIVDDTLPVDKVENDRQGALGENKEIYYGTDGSGGLIGDTTAAYDNAGSQFVIDPDDGFESAAEKQIASQNASYQQSLKEIGQLTEQAQKDYTKEQAGSYVDYMKGIDSFGVNAEQMAAMGLSRSGYNENSQVQAYVAYQNRVAVARESFNKIMLEYSNQMERARISNDAAIAQIYANSAQQLAALEIEKVAAIGQLVGQYQTSTNQINARYDSLWKDTLGVMQQNRENIESTILTTGVVPSDEALSAAGMTREEAEALKGRYETSAKNEQNTATNNAQRHILDLIQSGGKPNPEQIKAAGWTQEYVDSLNELYNPTIVKSSQISSTVDKYLADGNLDGAESYLDKMYKNKEIDQATYQEQYFNMALLHEVSVETLEASLDLITKWKNSGKITAADARSLEAYYYSQLGVSAQTAGITVTREGNSYKYNGISYSAYNFKEEHPKYVTALNVIATGSGDKTPARGTVVMFNGRVYVYDLIEYGIGEGWRCITGYKEDPLGDALRKYSNTHELSLPEHSPDSGANKEETKTDNTITAGYGDNKRYLR